MDEESAPLIHDGDDGAVTSRLDMGQRKGPSERETSFTVLRTVVGKVGGGSGWGVGGGDTVLLKSSSDQ